jgi:hypothetical protein
VTCQAENSWIHAYKNRRVPSLPVTWQEFWVKFGLAHAGFLLTPRVRNTEEMLSLLEPQSRAPQKSAGVVLHLGREWQTIPLANHVQLQLRTIDISTQPPIRGLLMSERLAQVPSADQTAGTADACTIGRIDGTLPEVQPVKVSGSMALSDWVAISVAHAVAPQHVELKLESPTGRMLKASAQRSERADIAGYFVHPSLISAGFDARIDLHSLEGPYTMTVEAERDGRSWQCKQAVKLLVTSSAG